MMNNRIVLSRFRSCSRAQSVPTTYGDRALGICFFLLLVAALLSLASLGVRAESYTYDAAGRLTSVTYNDGTFIEYSYDAAGNIVRRTVDEAADETAPIITLLGDSEITLSTVDSYQEPGATALDDRDGDISASIVITGSVNTAEVGVYTLTYSVADAAGNDAVSVTRTVTIELHDPPRIIDDDDNYWNAEIYSPTLGILSAEQAQLYRAYFGALLRLPDSGGYAWWLNEIREGRHTLETMAAGFIFSPEFKGLADSNDDGQISNEELILHIYNGVFGRPPDPGGFAWWLEQLDSGAYTQARAFIEMTQSNEYVENTLEVVAALEFFN